MHILVDAHTCRCTYLLVDAHINLNIIVYTTYRFEPIYEK